MVRKLAAAKINLSLKVTGRRDDGYHLLDTLVVFTHFGDQVEVHDGANISLDICGPFASGLENDADNLVIKAAHLLKRAAIDVGRTVGGAAIILEKHLPVASGIGGGSADAAATLVALLEHWGIEDGGIDLPAIALQLGADVPMCLRSKPLRATGIGEDIQPLALPLLAMVLVNPGIGVSTSAIFKSLALAPPEPRPEISPSPSHDALIDWLKFTQNDLQQPAISFAPVVQEVLDQIEGCDDCLLARMSGSGATCFGLFPSMGQAKKAARILGRENPSWWCVASPTKQ